MTVMECASKIGIAYCNRFLLLVGARIAASYRAHSNYFSQNLLQRKTQNEFGKEFTVWDYPDNFFPYMKLEIEVSLRQIVHRKSKI